MVLIYKKGNSRFSLPDLAFVTQTKPALHILYDGKVQHFPLILPDGLCYTYDEAKRFSYSPAIPAIHVIYNRRHYVVPNREADNHAIPKGMYIGQSAYNLFEDFIGRNKYRVLKNSVTIVHCGVTKTFSAGTAVWLTHSYNGRTINLTFSQNKSYMAFTEPGYSTSKEWWQPGMNTSPTIQLHDVFRNVWSEFPFYLKNGINFY